MASSSRKAWDSGVVRKAAGSKGVVAMVMSNLLRQGFGACDVAALGGFVATAEQDDDRLAPLHEMDAVAGAMVDPQLANAVEEFHIAHQAGLEAGDADGDLGLRAAVAQGGKPNAEGFGLAHLEHV